MYTFKTLDPRATPEAQAANQALYKESVNGLFGVEVSVPALVALCNLGNVDPQHGSHSQSYDKGSGWMEGEPSDVRKGETAIEFVARQPNFKPGYWVRAMIPPGGSTIVTIRPDLDSVGAMALLDMKANGIPVPPIMLENANVWISAEQPEVEKYHGLVERVRTIAESDSFDRGTWPGPQNLPTKENPWPVGSTSVESTRELAAIAAAIADFKVELATRVEWMKTWLLTGEEPAGYRERVEKERVELITALETGEIKYTVAGVCINCGYIYGFGANMNANWCPQCGSGDSKSLPIAAVESTHRAATMVGYSFAPVVVAFNPSFKQGKGDPYAKFTICAFEPKFADIKAATADLAQLEPGWGGSNTIAGSPQGVSSKLTIDQVVAVVEKHLR